jgi:hypothetical protein
MWAVVFVALAVTDFDSAEFSATDPEQTLRWMVRTWRKAEDARATGNEFKTEAARKAFPKELDSIRGREVRWPAVVDRVTKDAVHLRPVTCPAIQDADIPQANDPDSIKRDLPPNSLALSPVPLKDATAEQRQLYASLVAGQTVRLSGTVAGTTREGGERVKVGEIDRHTSRFGVSLKNAVLTLPPARTTDRSR